MFAVSHYPEGLDEPDLGRTCPGIGRLSVGRPPGCSAS
jgi:hypothetical protein